MKMTMNPLQNCPNWKMKIIKTLNLTQVQTQQVTVPHQFQGLTPVNHPQGHSLSHPPECILVYPKQSPFREHHLHYRDPILHCKQLWLLKL